MAVASRDVHAALNFKDSHPARTSCTSPATTTSGPGYGSGGQDAQENLVLGDVTADAGVPLWELVLQGAN